MLNKISLLMLSLAVCCGCAFGPRRPMLEYSAVLTPAAANSMTVSVREFKDERTWSKDKIGNVKDGFGIRMGEIIPQNSVTGWVKDAVKKELSNAGYTVADDSSAVTVEGSVQEVYTDAYWNYGGRVKLTLVVTKDGKEVLHKVYAAQKNCGMQWAATAASFGKTMEMTLQEALKQALPDINDALGVNGVPTNTR